MQILKINFLPLFIFLTPDKIKLLKRHRSQKAASKSPETIEGKDEKDPESTPVRHAAQILQRAASFDPNAAAKLANHKITEAKLIDILQKRRMKQLSRQVSSEIQIQNRNDNNFFN